MGNVLGRLGTASWRTIAVSVCVAAAIAALQRAQWRGKPLPKAFPLQFVVLTTVILVSWALSLDTYADVAMCGAMPQGFPAPSAPDFSIFHGSVYAAVTPGIVVATIAYAQSVGVAIT